MTRKLSFGLLAFVAACAVVPKPLPPEPPPSPKTLAFDLVACGAKVTPEGICPQPVENPKFSINVAPEKYLTAVGDEAGYAWVGTAPDLPQSFIIITADGYERFDSGTINLRDLAAVNAKTCHDGLPCHNWFELTPSHVDPSTFSLEQLAAIRGAMWPQTLGACGNLPIGPRPGQDTNIVATAFITNYSEADQDCIIRDIFKVRGYTHVVMGPLVDSDGYHGMWKPNDWRGANFQNFLNAVQKFYDNGLKVVVFVKPDNWSLEHAQAELTPLLQDPRAKKLLKIRVPMGWEAGANYEYSSCTWAKAGQWINDLLGPGITLVHMVSDRDAPAGGDKLCNDDDKNWNPGGNAAAWGRVVPYYHGWLVQYGAFDCPDCIAPNGKTNFQNYKDTFVPTLSGSYRNRFEHGYAGWPKNTSAWGNGLPLRVYAGEYSAYWRFWGGRTEAEGVAWGDAAMANGAYGYLDSGSVPVPVRR